MTWWPDRAKMSCLETGRGTRPEEIGSAGKKYRWLAERKGQSPEREIGK